jgi:LCP family protein required for cell wall assembly
VASARRSRLASFGTRLVVALVITAGLATAGVVVVNRTIDHEVDRIPRVAVDTAPEPDGGANYLLIGSDSRQFVETDDEATGFGDPSEETGKRSDTIMVIHVEPEAGRTTILSFPRDLWVNIPGIGNAKINAAFNSDLGGGPDTVIAALKSNFDIDINHYLEVDFVTFREIVDSLGRVPVYVERPAVDDFTGFVAVKAGCYYLDGTEALTWVRARHLKYLNPTTGRLEEDPRADIGRIERQQEFLRRLAGVVVKESLGNPFKAHHLADDVVDHLRVDQSFNTRDALDLVSAFRHVNPDDTSSLEFVTFPANPGNASSQDVLFPDRTAAEPILQRMSEFATKPPAPAVAPSDVRVKVLNGSGRNGIAQTVAQQLADVGFVKAGTGNDERGRVPVTEIRFANDADAKARALLPFVGTSAKLVGDPTLKNTDVTVVIGSDFNGLTLPSAATNAPAPPPDPAADAAAQAAAACR